MKKGAIVGMFLTVSLLLCTAPVHAWQGRMAGMGNVYGLVEDESDFLIHPAGIANGQGLNFYGNMRFGLQTTDKNSLSYSYAPVGDPASWNEYSYDASGRETQYEGLFGGAMPLGKGRMGVFFQYMGSDGELRGDFVGKNYAGPTSSISDFDLNKSVDDLALRILYGIPVSKKVKLGAELQIAYKDGNMKTTRRYEGNTYINETYGRNDFPNTLLYLGVPYDSHYYEASMKASLETMIGPAKATFTARAGLPFSSKNDYYYLYTNIYGGDHDGKVKGRSFGADAWVRVPLDNSLSLPFLVSFDYKRLDRKAEGREMLDWTNYYARHVYRDESMSLTAGGGVDMAPIRDMKIAAGLYYTYLKSSADFIYAYSNYPNVGSYWYYFDNSGFPDAREHKVTFKGAVEKVIAPDMTLNGGMNIFYGHVKQTYDYRLAYAPGTYTQSSVSSSAKGSHWGANASLGASFKAGTTIMEPYIAGGFERVRLSGDGVQYSNSVATYTNDTRIQKHIWSIGGGLALRF